MSKKTVFVYLGSKSYFSVLVDATVTFRNIGRMREKQNVTMDGIWFKYIVDERERSLNFLRTFFQAFQTKGSSINVEAKYAERNFRTRTDMFARLWRTKNE